MQPPRFKAPGARVGGAWASQGAVNDKRKRGRAGQRERAQVLREEPLCRLCLEAGRTAASTMVDHIRPLAWGGSDARSNKQGLCTPCHDAKSAAERTEAAARRL